jgi:hypothetical protein
MTRPTIVETEQNVRCRRLGSIVKRLRVPELIDDLAIESAVHEQALNGLRRLNYISGAANSIWNELMRVRRSDQALRILDVATGCGGGGLTVSRQVCGRNGNMSSPTVFFVYDALWRAVAGPIVLLGFDPGLAIEASLLC